MAQIIFNIPDDKLTEVIDALAERYSWAPELGTKGAYVKSVIAAYIKQEYQEQMAKNAGNTAYNNSLSTTAPTVID